MQGYGALSDSERRSLWLGLRFSPLLCFAGITLGTVLARPELLLVMAATAFVGGFLTPKHPFDYVYDAALRPLLGGPSVPPSPPPAASPASSRRPGLRRSLSPSRWARRRSPGSSPFPCWWWRQRS